MVKKIQNKINGSKKGKVKTRRNILNLFFSGIIMVFGLAILKFLPMSLFGKEILFDASAHIVIACFILYFVHSFIHFDKKWDNQYFIFSMVILFIISIQRILVNAHNDLGLLVGFILAVVAIVAPRFKEFGGKIK